jgi:hypothetical protein
MQMSRFTASAAAVVGGLLAIPTMTSAAAVVEIATPSAQSASACHWSVAPAPTLPGSSILYAVHAIASDDVWAVGRSGDVFGADTLAEHWDGTAWAVVPTPNPAHGADDGNVLDAVDATGPNDVWAVGSHIRRGGIGTSPFILHFDGDRWRRVSPPSGHLLDSSLTGVAAIAPDDAWIVGFSVRGSPLAEAPLAMHWDGTAWQRMRMPNPPGDRDDELTGITAVGPDDIWAVGQADERDTLTMHFNGDRWRIVRSPDPPGDARNGLNGVVAQRADDVWAVGTGATPDSQFAEHWDGQDWSLLRMPTKGVFDELAGVALQDDGGVWAVGLFRPARPSYQTLAERYDGATWTIAKTPSLDDGDQLEGITTVGNDIWAVGVTAAGPDFQPGAALILHGC